MLYYLFFYWLVVMLLLGRGLRSGYRELKIGGAANKGKWSSGRYI